MAHKLHRFSKSIFSSPQLITKEAYEAIDEFLSDRNSENYISPELFNDVELSNGKPSIENGVGILPLQGVISAKKSPFESLCDMTSYPTLLESMDYFIKEDVKTVFMDIDSGGGAAALCMESAMALKKKAADNDIRLIGYVNQTCGSAAMAIASVCTELYANHTAKVGSIGCVISLLDDSARMEKEGIKRIFLTSTDGKVPYEKDGSFRQEFLDDLQEDVMVLHNSFVNHVSEQRGISSEDINAMKSKMFRADVALEKGLIDGVLSVEEFYDYLASIGESLPPQQLKDRERSRNHGEEYNSNVAETQVSLTVQEDKIKMQDNTITPEMLAKMQETLDAQSAQLAAYQLKEKEAIKASLSAKLEDISFLAECKDSLVSFFMSSDDTNKALMNSVIDAAKLEVEKTEEASATLLANKETEFKEKLETAETEANAAKLEAQKVKEEFGKGVALEGDVIDKDVTADVTSGKARTALLEAKVKAKLEAQK